MTYLPIQDLASSLAEIDRTLDRIAAAINTRGQFSAHRIAGGGENRTRLLVHSGKAQVKVETSPVARGTVLSPVSMRVSAAVEEAFGFAEAKIVSFEDLFGGKLCAALDRQHPRDLFDLKLLYETEGLTDDLFRVFLIYVASSSRPLHELLSPHLTDLSNAFANEFAGMASEPIELERARTRLISDIHSRLKGNAGDFLRSVQAADPDFDLIGLPQATHLPAVKWKTLNLSKLRDSNAKKYREQTAALEKLLG